MFSSQERGLALLRTLPHSLRLTLIVFTCALHLGPPMKLPKLQPRPKRKARAKSKSKSPEDAERGLTEPQVRLPLKANRSSANGMHADGATNGLTSNLSQQLRAVSSPSLTDALEETALTRRQQQQQVERRPEKEASHPAPTIASAKDTTTTTTHDIKEKEKETEKDKVKERTELPIELQEPPAAAIVPAHTQKQPGVLQKFKRTLTHFNKPQQQQQQQYQQQQYEHGAAATGAVSPVVPAPLAAATAVRDLGAAEPKGQPNEGASTCPGTGAHNPGPAAATAAGSQSDGAAGAGAGAGKYRFGPLIWRSSKERRKTKYHRRDKCNSGDSGIQIELESDEQLARALAHASSGKASAPGCGGSGGGGNGGDATQPGDPLASMSSVKAKILRRLELCGERDVPESLPTRSFSQPNGLESIGIIGRPELEDSDSDSVTSHEEGGGNYQPATYGEVLYSFQPAGPQELALERGALIEILRKEIGPWWFGRRLQQQRKQTEHQGQQPLQQQQQQQQQETLLREILEPEIGWFPKEFVRLIQNPETDAFLQAHLAHRTPTSTIVGVGVGVAEATDDHAVAVDENNVTTIVIESSPSMVLTALTKPPSRTPTPTPTSAAMPTSVADATEGGLAPARSLHAIMDNVELVRQSAIKELLDTEINYVKLLTSICEGFLPAMSKRIDIFSPNSIRLIFSNMTSIYKFQRKFLEALRRGIEQNQIAKVFLKMHKGFLCYSTYCNAYPRALIELESYDRVKEAKIILDNCRETENLAELPLSAHLLAPVQRICRYPLHLSEILKMAPKKASEHFACDMTVIEQGDINQLDIEDNRETIDMALEAMKSITEAVNEGKRHSETIARHQASFQNFKGPPLYLHSTRFFLQIDATRQKQNLWNSSYTLFLFNNQLIYCKRDIIKRSQFIYKGRIFLDRCRVVNVRDGKMFGHTIKNSLRIYCEARDKWYDFSFRSSNRKHRFLNTLALERQFGGKTLYISEMTGFEYAFDERDYSDQSDYDQADSEGNGGVRLREYIYDAMGGNGGTGGTGIGGTGIGGTGCTSASGDSSVPDSPSKSHKYSDTLPKKSQSRDPTIPLSTQPATQPTTATTTATAAATAATTTNATLNGHTSETHAQAQPQTQTSSLGRRRLGNWFRKPKSTSSTPIQSPTHKAGMPSAELRQSLDTVAGMSHEMQMLAGTLTAAERARDTSSGSSS